MRIVYFLSAIIILGALLPPPLAAAEAPITVRIDRTDAAGYPQMIVEATVRNEYGVPIPGLAAANFDVSEDRTLRSRPITAVAPFVNPDVRLSVGLAVDVSGSMAGAKLRDAQEASRRFLDGLTDKDNVALIAFSNTIDLDKTDPAREHGFSADKKPLYAVIDRLQAGGWTPLYDAAYKGIRWAATAPTGNRVVLLFTDGREEKAADGTAGSRVANDDSPIREANRAGVPVFTIGLGSDTDEAYLKRLALETGGTYQHAADSAELARLFRNVSDLLKQQYRITYTSGLPADGQTHQLLVAVTVGQHNAFAEAAFGPLPLRLTLTTTPTATVTPTLTPTFTPTKVPEPTATPTTEPRPEPAALPPAQPFAPTSADPLGIPLPGWGGIGLGVITLAVLAFLGMRRGGSKAPKYRCLQCGHELPSQDSPCPSCGFRGSYKS